MRIQWGADSTAVTGGPTPTSVANTTNAVAWNIGAQDFDATVVLNVGQLPTLPAYVLSIKNAGTTKVDVQARVEGADTGSATQKWTVGAAPAVDVCAIAVNALQLTGTDQELAAELTRRCRSTSRSALRRIPTLERLTQACTRSRCASPRRLRSSRSLNGCENNGSRKPKQ
jgi:hypothetical protein